MRSCPEWRKENKEHRNPQSEGEGHREKDIKLCGSHPLLALANTLTVNVLERTREIGVLRAIGSLRRQVRRMVLAESLLLSALGIAIGILIGLWMSWLLVESLSFIGLPVPYFFPYTGVLVAVAVGLIFGAIAALAPAPGRLSSTSSTPWRMNDVCWRSI
jgi:predicted lysophospholipase L1 biosynthesis ABC-type transport system permease subunit